MSKRDNEKYWGPLSNKSYWLKRSEELDKVAKKVEKEVMKELSALYREAFRSIEKEAMFETYAFPMKDEKPEDETDEVS